MPMYTNKDGAESYQASAPINQDAYRTLRGLAREQNTSFAAQVRKAIYEYVARQTPPSSKVT